MSKNNKSATAEEQTIALEQEWTVLNGMAYGLTQPTLYGVITTNVNSASGFEVLNHFMQKWLEVDTTLSVDNQKKSHTLITSILTWQARLLQAHKVPVFEKFHIQPLESNNSNAQRYLVALPYATPELTRELLTWFVFVVNYFLANIEILSACSVNELEHYFSEANQHLLKLVEQFKRYQLSGTNTYLFVRAANALSIPVTHVALNIFRFGTAKYSYLLDSSFTQHTSIIGSKLAKSKSNTALVLRNAGLPAPVHFKVTSEEQVVNYCEKMGFPVVIKPDNLEQGQGVFAQLLTTEQALKAYQMAVKFSDQILIERHVYGDDYRITVLNQQVIKVVKRTVAGVVGDGKLNVMQLITKEQQVPYLQNVLRQTGKMPLSLDEEALDLLKEQKLNQYAIPDAERFIPLRRKSNISTGGTALLIDNCDVHPDNLLLAVRAAQVINLDLAGIDLLIADLSKSWLESDAIICEVNAQPQVGILVTPFIYEDMLQTLMSHKKGIAMHLIVHSDERYCPESIHVENLLKKYQCNTLASKSGLWIDNIKISKAFPNSFLAIKALIHNQQAESALCIMSQQDIENSGLPMAKFTSIDVYSDELIITKAMINFVDKLRQHTQNLNLFNINSDELIF